MIGMGFTSFVVLLVISIIVSAVLHYGCRFYATPGAWSFLSKLVVGWVGAWLGSPVIGHWWPGVAVGEVYIVPAVLGSFGLLIFMVDLVKSWMPPK